MSNPAIPFAAFRNDIGALIAKRIGTHQPSVEVIHVGAIADFAPPPPAGARTHLILDPSAPGDRRDFNLEFPDLALPFGAGALVIVAGIGFLAVWDRLESDLDRFLARWHQVVIAVIRRGFEPLPVEGHQYMLSVLLSAIPSCKFIMELDVYDPLADASRIRRHSARLRRLLWGTAPPTRFSALVISVKKRGSAGPV
jgi:hypothetical protein